MRKSLVAAALAAAFFPVALQAATVSFDFTGTNPGQSAPWNTPATIDPNVQLTHGMDFGPPVSVGVDGIRGMAANDQFAYETSVTGGAGDTDLNYSLANNLYLTFTVTPANGYALSLAGASFGADFIHSDWHSARQLDLFSSIDGFSAGQSLGSITQPKGDAGTFVLAGTFPNTAAYQGITSPVEFRLYVSSTEWGWKPGAVDNISIGGTTDAVPEPATLGLIALGGTLLLTRRRAR